jgi:hypothetical protein
VKNRMPEDFESAKARIALDLAYFPKNKGTFEKVFIM